MDNQLFQELISTIEVLNVASVQAALLQPPRLKIDSLTMGFTEHPHNW